VCSTADAGRLNKLNVYDFVYTTIPATRAYTLTMTRTSGPTPNDPDFFVFTDGGFLIPARSADENVEVLTANLEARDYFITPHDFENINQNGSTSQTSCYEFKIE